jgi:GNAT superfamily N-acetyltransferase
VAKTVLVVANETLGGRPLLQTIKEKAAEEPDLRVVVCVPRTNPRQGNIIYDEAVFDAAQVRIDLARKILREEGIENAIGEVGDPDPYTATMDAIAEHDPDEIVISTYPAASSGWLRRDLIERISEATRVPVEHVVVDLDQEGLPFGVTLAVANRTLASPPFLEALKSRATELERHVFIFVVPQEGGHGIAARQARARLTQMIDRARAAGLICAGMIADPDPYTAVMNGVQFFRVDDIVISTLPATRSGWLRADLIERVRRATNKPVEHVEAPESAEAVA